jgi:hypothetical protein
VKTGAVLVGAVGNLPDAYAGDDFLVELIDHDIGGDSRMQRPRSDIRIVPENGEAGSRSPRDEVAEALDRGDSSRLFCPYPFKLSRDFRLDLNPPELFFHGIP